MFALAAVAGAPAAACGPESDCAVGTRSYRIALPASHDGAEPLGAILFVHGYRGTAAGAMRNAALRALADDLGVALIAAQAAGDDWDIPGTPSNLDADGAAELAYFDAVRADAFARFGVDPARTMISGFSAGGMMVWTLICAAGPPAMGHVPVAGTFWQPVPQDCPAPPADVIHIHGTADRIVPMAGRPIGPAQQGDVDAVVAMYAADGAYVPAGPEVRGDLACERRENPEGRILDLCLFDGGHELRVAQLRSAWERLNALARR